MRSLPSPGATVSKAELALETTLALAFASWLLLGAVGWAARRRDRVTLILISLGVFGVIITIAAHYSFMIFLAAFRFVVPCFVILEWALIATGAIRDWHRRDRFRFVLVGIGAVLLVAAHGTCLAHDAIAPTRSTRFVVRSHGRRVVLLPVNAMNVVNGRPIEGAMAAVVLAAFAGYCLVSVGAIECIVGAEKRISGPENETEPGIPVGS
jgi:hypothetical protein